AIYALPDNRPIHVYVGQQMDVHVKAAAVPQVVSLDSDPKARIPFEDEGQPPAKANAPARGLRRGDHWSPGVPRTPNGFALSASPSGLGSFTGTIRKGIACCARDFRPSAS